MNSIWLKIAGVAVVAVVVIVVLGRLGGDKSDSAPPEEEKTFYDMAERDKQLTKPLEPAADAVVDQNQTPAAVEPPHQPAQAPAQPVSGVRLPSSITEPTTLYFKPLDEIEDIEAQRLMPVVGAGRSIGRLPGPQYGLMVQGCRQILQRWPDSQYAFQAKRMLEELAADRRYANTYKITPQDLDISKFFEPRPGTKPFPVEPVR